MAAAVVAGAELGKCQWQPTHSVLRRSHFHPPSDGWRRMSKPPAMQEETSKPGFSFRLSSKKYVHRLVASRVSGEPMFLFHKSQYISAQAGAPDILSLHPIFSRRCLNPLVSSSHIFRYVYNLNERTLQGYKGTGFANSFDPCNIKSRAFFLPFPPTGVLAKPQCTTVSGVPRFSRSQPLTPVDREGSEWHHRIGWSLRTGG